VISGPSGVGKSTIVDRLQDAWPFEFSVSATTRAPRAGEDPGVDYHFVNRSVFAAMVDSDRFLEWAEYADNLYGTPRRPVFDALDAGRSVLLDIEVNGAVQVMDSYDAAVTIFVMPPSIEELEARLRGRQDTDDTAITGRMAVAEMQMAVGRERFDHLVVNNDVEAAVGIIVRILEGVSVRDTDPPTNDHSVSLS
jgi:guanylate kinase